MEAKFVSIISFSIVMVILGLLVIVEGLRFLIDNPLYNITEMEGPGFTLSGLSLLSVLLGILQVLMGAIGLMHSFEAKKIFLGIYMSVVCVLLISVLGFTGFVIWAASVGQLNVGMSGLVSGLVHTRNTVPTNGAVLDLIQSKVGCCGAAGPSDYTDVPESCADYKDGCGEAFATFITTRLYIFAAVTVLVVAALGGLVAGGFYMVYKVYS